jgi:hypothetical protein
LYTYPEPDIAFPVDGLAVEEGPADKEALADAVGEETSDPLLFGSSEDFPHEASTRTASSVAAILGTEFMRESLAQGCTSDRPVVRGARRIPLDPLAGWCEGGGNDRTREQRMADKQPDNEDLKAKMREALDRKQSNDKGVPQDGPVREKAHGSEVVGGAGPKMHRRKAGGGGS